MGTRSQILFRAKWKVKNEETGEMEDSYQEAQIYRHSDGYPSGVLPDLMDFYNWNKGRNEQIDYAAANFIFFEKRKREEDWCSVEIKRLHKPHNFMECDNNNCESLKIGYGVEKGDHTIHGDEEWLYRITVEENGFMTGLNDKPQWIVEIADLHDQEVDRWEGEATFDSVKYQYAGTLEELVENKQLQEM